MATAVRRRLEVVLIGGTGMHALSFPAVAIAGSDGDRKANRPPSHLTQDTRENGHMRRKMRAAGIAAIKIRPRT